MKTASPPRRRTDTPSSHGFRLSLRQSAFTLVRGDLELSSAARRATRARRNKAASLLLAAALCVVTGATAVAESDAVTLRTYERFPMGQQPGVYLEIEPPDEIFGPQELYFFGGKRVDVPGSVAVNVPPYVCDVEGNSFSDKAEFAAHLRMSHGELLRQIADPFIVHEGQVHFVGK